MLGQSNNGHTRQPLPSLDFGDRDLTDAFVDVRDGTHSSISAFAHPRGSTPISILSSRRSTPSTALSMETSESRRTLPNMSALLEFLDNDNTNPFPTTKTKSSNRKLKSSQPRPTSSSPRSIPPTPSHPFPQTPRPVPSDYDLTSNFVDTYNNYTHRFQAVLPTSSTPYTNNRNGSLPGPEEISEISSPLNQRHVILPSVLKPNLHSLHFSEQVSNRQLSHERSPFDAAPGHLPGTHSLPSERAPGNLPLETPARINPKGPSAADRLAAAVMEGAPESQWTFRVEHDSTLNQAGIRRSKVVEELLQPIQPSISCTGRLPNHVPNIATRRSDDDLPKSLIDQTRRSSHVPHPATIVPSASSDSIRHSRLSKSAGYSPSSNLIRPIPQRPSMLAPAVSSQDLRANSPSTANEQVEVLDARVHQLLSHIRSDQLEKANLVSSLAEARAEVASLRDEVRLLRIGVQKLGEGRSYQSADARLERHPPPMRTTIDDDKQSDHHEDPQPQPSSSRCQRESLEVWLSENTTLPRTTNIGKSKLMDKCTKQPDKRPSSCSNLHDDGIDPSSRSRRQVSPVQSASNQKKELDKKKKRVGNEQDHNDEETRLIKEFKETRMSSESKIMKNLTQKFLGDLALGLSFTSQVDSLLMNNHDFIGNGNGGDGDHDGNFRLDSQIFTPFNLDNLLARLKVWKQIVRGHSINNHNFKFKDKDIV